MKTIVFSPLAARQLDALPSDARNRVFDAIADYAVSGRGDVKKLSGRMGYRMRIGPYRLIFDEDRTTILALQVLRRDTQTYRR